MQIVVLGMHRSGTSAVARLINMMGVYYGPEGSLVGATEHNAKGFWERRELVTINAQLLNSRGCTWFDLSGWQLDRADHSRSAQSIKSFVFELDSHRPWLLKDPRLCMTLANWLPYLEVPLVVVVFRSPLEIAQSLQRRNNMSFEHALALWETYAIGIIRGASSLPKVFTSYESLMADRVGTTRQLFDDLAANGVRRIAMPSDREVAAFVEPGLRHTLVPSEAVLTEHQRTLCEMLIGKVAFDPNVEVSVESLTIMRREAPVFRAKLS